MTDQNLARFADGEGPLTSNVIEAGGFVRSGEELDAPDIQLQFLAALFTDEGLVPVQDHGVSLGATLLKPRSRGRVALASPDPTAKPLIVHNYYADSDDLRSQIAGVRLTLQIARTEPLAGRLRGPRLVPDSDSDEDIEALIRAHAQTTYHPVGTCKMGIDELAVVDPELRVHGLRLQGDDRARSFATRGLEHARSVDSRWYAARNMVALGRLAAAREEWAEAEHLHYEALEAIVERGFRLELPGALEALAEVASGLGSYGEAARILGAAERARHELGLVARPAQHAEVDAVVARVRDALGAGAFNQARSEGAELGEEEAVAWIRRARGSRKRPASGWESLAPTELEVARHIAAGLTNPQIAARMFVSPATVKTHLAHIFPKLDIRTRSDLAAQATQRLPALEK